MWFSMSPQDSVPLDIFSHQPRPKVFFPSPTDSLLISMHSGGVTDNHAGGPGKQEHVVVPISDSPATREAITTPTGTCSHNWTTQSYAL